MFLHFFHVLCIGKVSMAENLKFELFRKIYAKAVPKWAKWIPWKKRRERLKSGVTLPQEERAVNRYVEEVPQTHLPLYKFPDWTGLNNKDLRVLLYKTNYLCLQCFISARLGCIRVKNLNSSTDRWYNELMMVGLFFLLLNVRICIPSIKVLFILLFNLTLCLPCLRGLMYKHKLLLRGHGEFKLDLTMAGHSCHYLLSPFWSLDNIFSFNNELSRNVNSVDLWLWFVRPLRDQCQ